MSTPKYATPLGNTSPNKKPPQFTNNSNTQAPLTDKPGTVAPYQQMQVDHIKANGQKLFIAGVMLQAMEIETPLTTVTRATDYAKRTYLVLIPDNGLSVEVNGQITNGLEFIDGAARLTVTERTDLSKQILRLMVLPSGLRR